ncbi:MAG: ParB/RepB/Spo0J family partition protein [Alphaproteobacteria bacterium]|nr:ParB/RepB/Spo0J family partition protein [Alphaproteobacteria bacterium]
MMSAASGKKSRNLGRGLSALLGDEKAFEDTVPAEIERASKPIPVEFLKPNPDQPRKRFEDSAIDSLVKSIEEKGILQPILVRRHPQEQNAYEIVAGERRWRAAQRAKLHEVPVIIKELSDADTLEFALIENIHREDLTPLEEAEGYHKLMEDFGHTQEALSKTVSKSRSHIANTLRLLTLPDEIKSMIDDGLLSAGHGRALVGVENAEELAHIILEKGLNVRQTEMLVKQQKGEKPTSTKSPKKQQLKDPNVSALEDNLSTNLGMKVKIVTKDEESGKLTIDYDNLDQLDEVIARLSNSLNIAGATETIM